MKNLTNRTTDPSCLVYKLGMNEENHNEAIMEFWSDRNPTVGDSIQSNQQTNLKVGNIDYYHPFRDFEISEILSVRDFKGAWDTDRERKNNNTYFTAKLKPVNSQVDNAMRSYELEKESKKKKQKKVY